MATVSQSTQWSVTLLCLLTTHSTVYWLVGQEEEEDSGLVLTTHQCSAVEGLVHSPAHSHQTPLTSHCTRILQELLREILQLDNVTELHSQGLTAVQSDIVLSSVDRTRSAIYCRLRVSEWTESVTFQWSYSNENLSIITCFATY